MQSIHTGGITAASPVPGGTGEWYYGIGSTPGDLYEAEQLFRSGNAVPFRSLCLIHYPDGTVYQPIPRKEGSCPGDPVFWENGIYLLNADFPDSMIRILRFCCSSHTTEETVRLPLRSVRDCCNLALNISPVTLRRQGGSGNLFEILWPEKTSFVLGDHESFFLRDGERLFFNRWHEQGEGAEYRYWEDTVVRDLQGRIIDILPGDVQIMPNGEMWHLY